MFVITSKCFPCHIMLTVDQEIEIFYHRSLLNLSFQHSPDRHSGHAHHVRHMQARLEIDYRLVSVGDYAVLFHPAEFR